MEICQRRTALTSTSVRDVRNRCNRSGTRLQPLFTRKTSTHLSRTIMHRAADNRLVGFASDAVCTVGLGRGIKEMKVG